MTSARPAYCLGVMQRQDYRKSLELSVLQIRASLMLNVFSKLPLKDPISRTVDVNEGGFRWITSLRINTRAVFRMTRPRSLDATDLAAR